jgi:hypothetical protein
MVSTPLLRMTEMLTMINRLFRHFPGSGAGKRHHTRRLLTRPQSVFLQILLGPQGIV